MTHGLRALHARSPKPDGVVRQMTNSLAAALRLLHRLQRSPVDAELLRTCRGTTKRARHADAPAIPLPR